MECYWTFQSPDSRGGFIPTKQHSGTFIAYYRTSTKLKTAVKAPSNRETVMRTNWIIGVGFAAIAATGAAMAFIPAEAPLSKEQQEIMALRREGMNMDIQSHYLNKRSINPETVKIEHTDRNGSFKGYVVYKDGSRTYKDTCIGRYDAEAKAVLWNCG